MAGTVDVIDRDREARAHLWGGLQRMTPPERIAFLSHACEPVKGPGGIGARVTKHSGEVVEAYMDIGMLGALYGRDLYDVCREMEDWLRKRGAPSR